MSDSIVTAPPPQPPAMMSRKLMVANMAATIAAGLVDPDTSYLGTPYAIERAETTVAEAVSIAEAILDKVYGKSAT